LYFVQEQGSYTQQMLFSKGSKQSNNVTHFQFMCLLKTTVVQVDF
jgi:hypothetical protein